MTPTLQRFIGTIIGAIILVDHLLLLLLLLPLALVLHPLIKLSSFYGRENDHKAMAVRGAYVLYSHACKLLQRLPLQLMLTMLEISQLGSSTNGFVHSSSLRELQGTTSFLPSHPQKNLYCITFLPNLALPKSLECFMQTTYSHTQSTI